MVFENIDLSSLISNLENMGFYQVALPFILVFVMSFGVLEKARIFGQDSTKFNVVIAFILAFLVVRVQSIVSVFNTFLPRISLIVLIIIATLIILGIFGLSSEKFKGAWLLGALIFGIMGVVWALGGTSMQLNLPAWLQISGADQAWLIGLGAFVLLIYFITRESPSSGGAWSKSRGALRKGLEELDGQLGRGGNNP